MFHNSLRRYAGDRFVMWIRHDLDRGHRKSVDLLDRVLLSKALLPPRRAGRVFTPSEPSPASVQVRKVDEANTNRAGRPNGLSSLAGTILRGLWALEANSQKENGTMAMIPLLRVTTGISVTASCLVHRVKGHFQRNSLKQTQSKYVESKMFRVMNLLIHGGASQLGHML